MPLNKEQQNKLEKIISAVEAGDVGIAKLLFELEDRFDKKFEEELPNVYNILAKLKGDKGDNYVITDEDKKEIVSEILGSISIDKIASMASDKIDEERIAKKASKYIKPVIVDKVIEKTETIVEQPIHYETIKEITNNVENEDTGEQIVEKINSQDTLIKAEKVEGLKDVRKNIKELQERPATIIQGVGGGASGVRDIRGGTNITVTKVNEIYTIDSTGGGGGTPGGSDTQLQYNNAGAFGGITGATTNGTAVTFATDGLIANNLKAATSAGFLLESNSGTDVALFGAGGGAGTTFYGGVNIDGQTRLATSLTGLAKLTSGVVSAATAGTDYENPLTFSTGLTRSTNTITSDLSTGVSGGQTATGGTASGNNLTLRSTSHATKGSIIMGGTYYDEVNNRLGINNSTPFASLTVTGTTSTTSRIGWSFSNTYGQTYLQAAFSSVSQNGNTFEGYINQIGGTGSQWLSVLGNLSVQFFNNVTTSGVFYAGTGSATFPSLSFGSDSNTGIYRFGIDTLGFSTGGTFRGSINSAGTLTIGAGTVAAIPLSTSGTFVPAIGAFTTSGSAGISAGVTDGTNNRRAGLFVNQTDALWGLSLTYSSGRIPFVLLSNTTEQLRVDTSHNFGIGTGATISARLHAISTTEQFRLGYDASNYKSETVDSSGNTTMALVGTSPKFTFSQAVKISTLTSGRIPFATTGGELIDDADLTFATDTLTATKIVGTTSVKVGTAAGFISSDGSTGATGTFTTADLKTVTVKDGIITSIV